jgi:putative MATE family efflux protein
METNVVLDDDRIGRLLLKLSAPAFLGMLVITLYNVVDTIFIGHFVGSLGIAGLSIVFPLQMFSMGLGQMTGMGGASPISRLLGAGDIQRAERVLGNAIAATLIISIILLVAGLVAPDFWLRALGASDTILPYARDYMVIILMGIAFPTFAMTLSSLIIAEGNASFAMRGMIIGGVSNIILVAIFIIPLKMGIRGAATATVIAQFLSVMYLLSYYFTGRNFLKIRPKNLLIEWGLLRTILAIGVSSLARTLAGSISQVVINRMLIVYGGDLAVSTIGILHRIVMFAMMPGIVIGQGLQPILGFNYGAKRPDRALRVIKIAMIAATTCSVIVFFVVYFFPQPIIRIFTSDNELISLSIYAVKHVFIAIYVVGFMMVGSTIFQAIGKATQSFITAIARPALFVIPLIFILPQFWQLDGIWYSFPIADALTALLTLLLLIPQIMQLRRMDATLESSVAAELSQAT